MGMWVFEHKGHARIDAEGISYFFDPAEFVLINANNRVEAMAYVRKYEILEPLSEQWNWGNQDRTCHLYEGSGALRQRVMAMSQCLLSPKVREAGTLLMVEHYFGQDVRNVYDMVNDEFKYIEQLSYEQWGKKPELVTPTFVSKPRPDLKDWGLF